jgi:dipeptidase D
MTDPILNLRPERLWKHFYEITRIPHPSKHEEKIRDYVVEFAEQRGIEYRIDKTGNVILRRPATPGMEDRKGIVLQAHLDMVPQKNGDKVFDFTKDPIGTRIDGDWVTADGTTLGADNGIGVAAILSVFESDDLTHGPLEALLTIDEETGMTGAFGLEAGELDGSILLNLDSEEEGELCVGCAGGLDMTATLHYKQESINGDHACYDIEIKGLKGGHSGTEIILQRGNSNKILFRFLKRITRKFDVRLVSVDGGGLRNAIPREAAARVLIPRVYTVEFLQEVKDCELLYQREIEVVDPGLSLTVAEVKEVPDKAIDTASGLRIIDAVCACPNGVIRMSDSMKGLVETSTNLSRVVSQDGKVTVALLLRSSVNSAKDDLAETIASVFELADADIRCSGGYDGWKPDMNSFILHTMQETYRSLFGTAPMVKAIHAGLECGIIGGKYPGMDMISIGPTIVYPHSPDEKAEIASVDKFWRLLVESLRNAPSK